MQMQGTGIIQFVAGRKEGRVEMRYEMNGPHEAEGPGDIRRRFRTSKSSLIVLYMAYEATRPV